MQKIKNTNIDKTRIKPVLAIVFSALSFLLLIDSIWTIGIICAIVSVILSSSLIKKADDSMKKWGLVGVLVTLTAAITFLITSR